ncbi:MAG: hypothetical protein BWY76_03351 [bacterium ADurb.Bin429]|nr:MAG: hypothetical protein BWY76_03351 [bacterium ADurb.Bin429]
MMQENMTVRRAYALRWSIIPARLNKRPCLPTWDIYQESRADMDTLLTWRDRYHPYAWAVVTGKVSGLVIIDFDGDQALTPAGSWACSRMCARAAAAPTSTSGTPDSE